MIIVADATPLITLALCDCLTILPALFQNLAVTQSVYGEVTVVNKSGSAQLALFLQDKIYSVESSPVIIGSEKLDKGELSAMALYKQLSADFLLIDEKTGRRVAKANHIKIIGSLGVLIEAKNKGIIDKIKPHIEILRETQIYFSDTLLDHALKLTNE